MAKMDFMITSPSNPPSHRKQLAGFTLVEVMIAAGLGSIILAGVLATFLSLVRSGIITSNYSVMETETRRAFEQLGIDSRMANQYVSTFSGSEIVSFTLTIPNNDLSDTTTVTYGFDTSDSTNKKFYMDSVATGRRTLVNRVDALTFLRYDKNNTLIPTSTTSDAAVKHIQVSVNVSRSGVGVMTASQFIRSSAFTIRNIITI